MKDIKVSVIIYVKNAIAYIEQCIRSVMSQSLQEIEIIVVDGGSSDGTLAVIESLLQEDDRVVLLNADPSVGMQFNTGLMAARGKYIGICEADDYILPNMYEKQYALAEKHDLDIVRSDYYQFFSFHNHERKYVVKACHLPEKYNRLLVFPEEQSSFLLDLGVNGFWTGIYKREFLNKNNIRMNETKGAAHQDITFAFLSQMYAGKVWFMDEPSYCYRIDNPGASANSSQIVEQHCREYDLLRDELIKRELWEEQKNMFYSWEISSYKWILRMIPALQRENAIDIIYQQLSKQAITANYNPFEVIKGFREAGNAICERNRNNFENEMLHGMPEKDRMISFLGDISAADDDIVIFGAGHLGSFLIDYLSVSGVKYIITDNDIDKQLNGVMGKEVLAPGEVVTRFPNSKYVIANGKYANEIKEQLLESNISENHIFIFDDEEVFLRKVFVRNMESYGHG